MNAQAVVEVGTGANAGGSFYGRNAPGSARILVDEDRRVVVGVPQFTSGDDIVVFLRGGAPALPTVFGLSQGLFRVVRTADGRAVVAPAPLTGNLESGKMIPSARFQRRAQRPRRTPPAPARPSPAGRKRSASTPLQRWVTRAAGIPTRVVSRPGSFRFCGTFVGLDPESP